MLNQSNLEKQVLPLGHQICCASYFIYGQVVECPKQHFEGVPIVASDDIDVRFVNVLKQSISAFSNSQGGCILIGSKKLPLGQEISGLILDQGKKEQIKRIFNRINGNFYPPFCIFRRELEVSFVPLLNPVSRQYITGRCAIRIRVQAGSNILRCFQLQERSEMLFFMRKDGRNVQIEHFQDVQQQIVRRRGLPSRQRNKCALLQYEGVSVYEQTGGLFNENMKQILIEENNIRKRENYKLKDIEPQLRKKSNTNRKMDIEPELRKNSKNRDMERDRERERKREREKRIKEVIVISDEEPCPPKRLIEWRQIFHKQEQLFYDY